MLWQAYWGGLVNREMLQQTRGVAEAMGLHAGEFETLDAAYRQANAIIA